MILSLLLTILVGIIIFSVCVLIHEAGHYFMAKKFGIKVEEFGFGFPPRLFGIKRGETIYSINWLPIGGFVSMYGEDEAGGGRIGNGKSGVGNQKDLHKAFFAHPAWQRAIVIVAGVVMNILLSMVIFYVFLIISGFKTVIPCVGPVPLLLAHQNLHCTIEVSEVTPHSPAQAAGIKAPARIIAINHEPLYSAETFTDLITQYRGKQVAITWENEKTNEQHTALVIPRLHPPKNQGSLGVVFNAGTIDEISYDTVEEKLLSGIVHPVNWMIIQYAALTQLFNQSAKTNTITPIAKNVSGPIGIVAVIGSILAIPDTKTAFLQLLNITGLISISLAFMNVLPIPALDGGRLFFIIIEALTGKKIDPKIEGYIHSVFFILLIGLVILITYKDIMQFVFHQY